MAEYCISPNVFEISNSNLAIDTIWFRKSNFFTLIVETVKKKVSINNNTQDIYDFTSSGFTASKIQDVDIANSNRVGNSVYQQTNFGTIDIDWNQQPLKVTFKVINQAGEEKFNYSVFY